MRRVVLIALPLALVASFAFAWTQDTQADWLKGIIYAGSGKKQLTDASGNLIAVQTSVGATGSVTANDLAAFAGTGGKQLRDSGVPMANVVLVSRAVNAGTGLTVTNSGLLSADITMSIAQTGGDSVLGVSAAATGNPAAIAASTNGQVLRRASNAVGFGQIDLSDGTNAVSNTLAIANGGIGASTAATGFINLSPQTTKGDLISYSTVPVRVAVGTTGQLLQADPTVAGGLSYTTDKIGVATNSNAASGYVGETYSINRLRSNALALSNGVTVNVGTTTSISVPPGDWDVHAAVCYKPAATTTINGANWGVSRTSAALPPSTDEIGVPAASGEMYLTYNAATQTPTTDFCYALSTYRVSFSVATSLFLVANSGFGTSTNAAYGYMEVRRVR